MDGNNLLDPARTVIERFRSQNKSGVTVVAEITNRHPSSVRRWRWSKSRGGTDGLIPSQCQGILRAEAEKLGIDLPAGLLIGGGG